MNIETENDGFVVLCPQCGASLHEVVWLKLAKPLRWWLTAMAPFLALAAALSKLDKLYLASGACLFAAVIISRFQGAWRCPDCSRWFKTEPPAQAEVSNDKEDADSDAPRTNEK